MFEVVRGVDILGAGLKPGPGGTLTRSESELADLFEGSPRCGCPAVLTLTPAGGYMIAECSLCRATWAWVWSAG